VSGTKATGVKNRGHISHIFIPAKFKGVTGECLNHFSSCQT